VSGTDADSHILEVNIIDDKAIEDLFYINVVLVDDSLTLRRVSGEHDAAARLRWGRGLIRDAVSKAPLADPIKNRLIYLKCSDIDLFAVLDDGQGQAHMIDHQV
jgi:hypothetical protein